MPDNGTMDSRRNVVAMSGICTYHVETSDTGIETRPNSLHFNSVIHDGNADKVVDFEVTFSYSSLP